jgi:hypothetical protein
LLKNDRLTAAIIAGGLFCGSAGAKPSAIPTEVHCLKTGRQLCVFALPDGY